MISIELEPGVIVIIIDIIYGAIVGAIGGF